MKDDAVICALYGRLMSYPYLIYSLPDNKVGHDFLEAHNVL